MPSLKPAEFGEIFIPGLWNGTTTCTPSEFLSDYNYGNSFYSFDAGLVHVIFINPYTPSHPDSKQYNFLLDDFSRVDRSKTPWIVILSHCPMYNSNKAHAMELQTMRMKVREKESRVK